jgi:hypothetical protein
MSELNDPQHWRDRAEEARAQAERFTHGPAREQMLEVAERYERIAELVARGRETLKPRNEPL